MGTGHLSDQSGAGWLGGAFCNSLIEPGAAVFADRFDRTRFAEAVGHALCQPALDAELLGQLTGVKWPRQPPRQESEQINGRMKLVDFQHVDQPLIFDLMIAGSSPPPPPVTRVSPFFDFHQRHFEHQPPIWKNAREMDQLVEQVEQPAPFRALSPLDNAAARAAEFDQHLAGDDRFDQQHAVFADERGDFVADGRERGELNFHQLVRPRDIDAVTADALLNDGAFDHVAFFQLAVERRFHVTR